MALQSFGWFPPNTNSAFTAPTARNMQMAGDYVGSSIIAPVTDTITEIRFATSTVSTPILELEGALVTLDSTGMPTGADIAVSSTTVSNPSASTNYSVTISASVTAGNWYGLVVRVKTYTSGSANLRGAVLPDFLGSGAAIDLSSPVAFYNVIGSSSKTIGWGTCMPKFSSNGWMYVPGVTLVDAAAAANTSVGAASGNVLGNKLTLNHKIKVWGYCGYLDFDYGSNIEMYAGSDNTAISGSSVTLEPGYRRDSSALGKTTVLLTTPLTLDPGVYRVGIRNTTASANAARTYTVAEAGMQEILGFGCANMHRTSYASGSWTDTTTGIVAVFPLIAAVDTGTATGSSVEFLGAASL